MFYLVGVSIAFFLGILLLFKKCKSSADIILAAWLMLIGGHLLLFYLFISNTIFNYPHLLAIHFPIPLFHGPLLYMYAYALIKNKKIQPLMFIHFMPAIVMYLLLINFYSLSAEEKVRIFESKGAGYEWFGTINTLAIFASGVSYVLLTALLLFHYKKNIYNQFSNIEKIKLNWLVFLLIGIALIWVFVIIGSDQYVFTLAVLFVVFIGFFGIRQTNIFTTTFEALVDEVPIQNSQTESFQSTQNNTSGNSFEIEKKKYQKSGLSTENAKLLYEKLEEIMLTQKLYTQCDLTLVDLARRLETHPNYLSQVINELAGKNFYDYVNNLRIEEFKRLALLPENRKLTILAIAFDSGFNSKSAFNKNFKQITGISPSEFIAQIKFND